MKKQVLILTTLLLFTVVAGPAAGEGGVAASALQTAVADPFPNACVDCHQYFEERGFDVRLSTLLGPWQKGEVSPRALRAARAAAGGLGIEGRHPDFPDGLGSVPRSCVTCHVRRAAGETQAAPPFAELVHFIHLEGGEENHYVVEFQSSCAHCHKLDAATGAVFVPSAEERPGP